MVLYYLMFLGQLYWNVWNFCGITTVTSSASKEQREILVLSQKAKRCESSSPYSAFICFKCDGCACTPLKLQKTASSSAKEAIRQPLKSNQEHFLYRETEYF